MSAVPSRRNAIGMLALVVGLFAYALVAMVAGAALADAHWLAQFCFYVVAGLAWLWPARLLLRWMARG
ncbi:MAG: DUF2842 domain-containing protein [Alphaproteobacteria bacterium]